MKKLTENKRIALNVFASYGRSLFGLCCGLISGRWGLMALGEVNYGLLGLIGGLVGFVSFFNSVLAGAVARFYAVSVGEQKQNYTSGLDNCQKWFNTALTVHTVLSFTLIIIGYPIGIYAIKHWLEIPLDRIDVCIWLWRLTCLTCFLGMFSVPWNAFYTAKQLMFELTIYSVITTALNVVFLYYIVNHEGDWLLAEGIWRCVIAVVPQVIISIRALWMFPECSLRKEYLWSITRFKQLVNYSGWQLFGCTGALLRSSGMTVLANKYFGPVANASSSVADSISAKSTMLSGAFLGAFSPAIANAYGAGDYEKMRKLSFSASKFSTFLTLLFVLPLSVELPLLLHYWLKNPPQYSVGLCYCVFATVVVDQLSTGHMMAVNAKGKIALYQATLGTLLILCLPIAWCCIYLGAGVYSIGYGALIGTFLCAFGRVFFAQSLVRLSIKSWFSSIFIPVILLIVCSLGIGFIPHLFMCANLLRVLFSLFLTFSVFLCLSYLLIFTQEEKEYIFYCLKKMFRMVD